MLVQWVDASSQGRCALVGLGAAVGVFEFGWTDQVGAQFGPWAGRGLVPGRVVKQARDLVVVVTDEGELQAEVSGRFRRAVVDAAGFPAVGDWVAVQLVRTGRAVVEAVLPRRSVFARQAAGGVAAWASGAEPVIVLNKADLAADLAHAVAVTVAAAPGVAVLATTALDADGVEALLPYLCPGRTIAVLGSSGVGKSTLVNTLLGAQRLATGPVGEAAKGRHTTTARELVRLPGGALLIDTPGLRELGLWADEDSLDRTFDDIDALAPACRFPDCRHQQEPECAVRAAVAAGRLDPERLASYLKLRHELEVLAARKDEKAHRRHEKAVGRDFAVRRQEVRRNKPGSR